MIKNGKREWTVAARPGREHLEKLLDQALAHSFPASDPVAVDFEAPAISEAREEEELDDAPLTGQIGSTRDDWQRRTLPLTPAQ